MYHWEKCDLTCNSKKVTDTQTDDKVPFESKPQAAHEVQDEVLFFLTSVIQMTQTHSIAFESHYKPGRIKIFDEKRMK